MSLENLGLSSDEQYKKNFTEEERAEHLPVDDAQDLANMMRAKMDVDPSHTGEKNIVDKEGNHRPTGFYSEVQAYEYQKTLNEIEELQKLAEEQTKGKEVIHRVGEIIQEGGHALSLALASVGIAFMADPKQLTQLRESFERAREENKFFDAKKKLKELIESGQDFGKKEGIDTKSSV